jgi:excisionase family DNA binding protein
MPGTIQETNSPLALSVETASKLSSLSKVFLRLEIKRGRLRVVRPGNSRRIVILMPDFMNYLNGGNDEQK